jgi:hypothetical protein
MVSFMQPKMSDDEFSSEEIARRRDAVIKHLFRRVVPGHRLTVGSVSAGIVSCQNSPPMRQTKPVLQQTRRRARAARKL